jgi:hypothetical protein
MHKERNDAVSDTTGRPSGVGGTRELQPVTLFTIPFSMKYSWLINTLIGMRTKEITLRLY